MNNTKIELEYEGEKYTLEYNIGTVKMLESSGFNLNEFLTKPMTNIELAFQGAFVKNHPKVSVATVDAIYKHCGDKAELIAVLKKMIEETYEALFEDEEDESKKVSWKTVDLTPKSTK